MREGQAPEAIFSAVLGHFRTSPTARPSRAASKTRIWLQRMQGIAMLQAEGVQFRTWEQKNHCKFATEAAAMAHGFYTIRKAANAFPKSWTQGVPAVGKCKQGRRLPCANQSGEYWNPVYPETYGVTGMNQAAVYLQELEDPPNKLGIDKNWPAQVTTAMEVKVNMEHGGFKSLTHWGHVECGRMGSHVKIKIDGSVVYKCKVHCGATNVAYATLLLETT